MHEVDEDVNMRAVQCCALTNRLFEPSLSLGPVQVDTDSISKLKILIIESTVPLHGPAQLSDRRGPAHIRVVPRRVE